MNDVDGEKMNPEYTERAKMTTTIQIPIWLAHEIKNAGMTYPGAMVHGWNAIQQEKQANQTISDLRRELESNRALLKRYAERWMESVKEKEDVKNV